MTAEVTADKLFAVADTLATMLPYAQKETALDMYEAGVSENRRYDTGASCRCGTVHCFAGWYYLAKKWDGTCDYLPGGRKSYLDGLILLDRVFGGDPAVWAGDNPRLWGNKDGNHMFSCDEAFTGPGRPDGAKKLGHIVDHLREVGFNTLLHEEMKNES